MNLRKKLISKFKILLGAATIGCIGYLGYFYYSSNYLDVSYKPGDYITTTDNLSNPYIGYYKLYGYLLSDTPATPAKEWSNNVLKNDENQLVLLEINLKNYRENALSDAAVAELDDILKVFCEHNKQIILRYLYDWDGNGMECEPPYEDIIYTHMNQVSGVTNNYQSNIYIVQGDFTGSYGEMHTTNYGENISVCNLMNGMYEKFSSEIFLAVRTPALWRLVANTPYPTSDTFAYQYDLQSRLSLYNDGMLGSEFDTGTYDDTPYDYSKQLNQKGTRSEELDFQYKLCQYVPNGGEVIIDNEYNDLDNAIRDLNKMHVSYLNMDYDPAVLNKWKSVVTMTDDAFKGTSGYDYIGSHLGYRYILKDSSVSFHSIWNNKANLKFSFENIGFSSAYIPFKSEIVICDKATNEIAYTNELDIDIRRISSGDTHYVTTDLDLKSYKKSDYNIYLRITDDRTGQIIKFGTEGNDDKLGIFLGEISIK